MNRGFVSIGLFIALFVAVLVGGGTYYAMGGQTSFTFEKSAESEEERMSLQDFGKNTEQTKKQEQPPTAFYTSAALTATPSIEHGPLTISFNGRIDVVAGYTGSAILFYGDGASAVMGRAGPTLYNQQWLHTYPRSGEYDVTLVLSAVSNVDADIEVMESPHYFKNVIVKKIRVKVAAPETVTQDTHVTVDFTTSAISGTAPLTVTFIPPASAGSETIAFGDGTSTNDAVNGCVQPAEDGCPVNGKIVTHTYSTPGVYTAKVSRRMPSTILGETVISVTAAQ